MNSDAKKAAPAAPSTDAIVDQWFDDHIHNSPVSRNTEAFNHALAAKEALKKALKAGPAPATTE